MIKSMTGYGQAEGRIADVDYAVEIRAVNNRYLRATVKLPEQVSFLEEHIDKLLRDTLQRGTVNFNLRVRGTGLNAVPDINEEALRQLTESLTKVHGELGTPTALDLGSLLSVPGVLRPTEPDEETLAHIRDGVLDLSRQALERLQEMRTAEGQFLDADLADHCTVIREDLERIKTRTHTVIQDQAERLRNRVDQLLAEAKLKLDEETLAREVAILADRADISEEISRLESHLAQFRQACDGNEKQVGRRLDFISQEMLREANTIGSKSSDVDICQWVVNIKCRIDRIKEQVQNVE